jgi:hypothetical protein
MPPGTTVADYLDAIRYRRYSRSVLLERRRYLAYALLCGDDAWLMAAPEDEVTARLRTRSPFRSTTSLQRAWAALEDYRDWRRRREGRGDA